MDRKKLAELLFPKIDKTPDYYEKLFPKRDLPQGAIVTRFAPSPTGFVHFGSLFPIIVSERLAHQSGGVFYLRIEDTDEKREVEGAVEDIIRSFSKYNIHFDEGMTLEGGKGNYGPYKQSLRAEIYQTYAKRLVEEGKAYPCFCTEAELEEMRAEQEAEKMTPGYYGRWAKYRDADISVIEEKLAAGLPFVLRFRSEGDINNQFKFNDLIKGEISVTENNIDLVLLKSDGIPTYHFAHAIDDHLMRTTHVVRGDEWLPSLPFHIQLFDALGFERPKFLHISPLMKLEGESKKKLSKRNREAALSYYSESGYIPECVVEYVMTLLNSNFEEWRAANPAEPLDSFKFSIDKMSASGALFDLVKLYDVSKNTVAYMSAEKVYDSAVSWSRDYDKEFYDLITRDPEYTKSIFEIGRNDPKPRKDIALLSELRDYMGFFFDELFEKKEEMPENVPAEDVKAILEKYRAVYDENDDSEAWFGKITAIAVELGYAAKPKEYKKNPELYKGHVGDVSMVLRVAVTGKRNSPDMYTVMKILGKDRVLARLDGAK